MRGNTGAPVNSALAPPMHGCRPGRTWKRRVKPPPAIVMSATTAPSTFRSVPSPFPSAMSAPKDGAHGHRSCNEQDATRLRPGAELVPAREPSAFRRLGVQDHGRALGEDVLAVVERARGAAALDARRGDRAPPRHR